MLSPTPLRNYIEKGWNPDKPLGPNSMRVLYGKNVPIEVALLIMEKKQVTLRELIEKNLVPPIRGLVKRACGNWDEEPGYPDNSNDKAWPTE